MQPAPTKNLASTPGGGRRRVPRRSFESPIGVMIHGKYGVERAYQVGEGGMMISVEGGLKVGTQLVVSFFIGSEIPVIVRGVVRNVVAAQSPWPERYGIEFVGLNFHSKREIRNFVASATALDE